MIGNMLDALEDWWYEYKEIIIFMLLIVLVAVGAIYAIVYTNQKTCERLEQLSPQYEFDFSFWGGCWVKTSSGYWVNADRYFQRLEFVPMEK